MMEAERIRWKVIDAVQAEGGEEEPAWRARRRTLEGGDFRARFKAEWVAGGGDDEALGKMEADQDGFKNVARYIGPSGAREPRWCSAYVGATTRLEDADGGGCGEGERY